MMTITCSACAAELTIPDEHAGRVGRCQNCNARITIPERASAEPKSAGTSGSEQPLVTRSTAQFSGEGTTPEGHIAAKHRLDHIEHDANVVRWGSTLVTVAGWITSLLGAVMLLVGVLRLLRREDDLGAQMADSAIGWTQVQGGISLLVAGILLIALAAFFRLVARMSQLIGAFLVDRSEKTP
jgi:hypothetical protein